MKKDLPYILGLDLGITSVGWAIVEIEEKSEDISHKRLIDTGVRIFESAVDKDDNTGAAVRRSFRSARKRLRRRAHRLSRIKSLLLKHNLLSNLEELDQISNSDPYFLRYKALDSNLTNTELSRVLLHLSKRRGFKSNRKNIEKDEGGGKEYGESVKQFRETLQSKGYRTAGEALYKDVKYLNLESGIDPARASQEELDSTRYGHQKRNRRGRFIAVFTRDQIEQEIKLILESQKNKGNKLVTDGFIEEFTDLWSAQRHYFNAAAILQTVGTCSIFCKSQGYEADELRAPINSFGYNQFKALQSILNYLQVDSNTGEVYAEAFDIETNAFQRVTVEDLPRLIATIKKDYIDHLKTFKTNHLRALISLDKTLRLRGEYLKEDGKLEDRPIFSSPDYLKKTYKTITDYYPELIQSAKHGLETIDRAIIKNLAIYREEEDLQGEIAISLEKEGVNFDKNKLERLVEQLETKEKYGNLSLKAIWELIPLMEAGNGSVVAINKLKEKYGLSKSSQKFDLLPAIQDNTLTNPRVKRVLAQTRKVTNAIIRKYGAPTFVHIELGRDLKNSEDTKKQISKFNRELEKKRKQAVAEITDKYGIKTPSNTDIQRFLLWKEQNEHCILSGDYIHPEDLFTKTEIDHAIPWSRCADNSFLNRILVTKKANQEKGNKTPFEYFGSNQESKGWKEFVNRVNSMPLAGRKKAKLTSTIIPEGFAERDLNDTRYASVYIKNYFEENLKFREFDRKARVVTLNGSMTSLIRLAFSGMKKTRDNDRHHAMDALIAAVTTRSMIKKISDFSARNEPTALDFDSKRTELLKAIPKPWEGFFADARARIFAEGEEFEIYQNSADTKKRYGDIMGLIKPLFVSRAVNKRVYGPAHAETVYRLEGTNSKGLMELSVKKPLTAFSEKNLEQFGIYDSDTRYINQVSKLSQKDREEVALGKVKISKDKGEKVKTHIYSTRVGSTSNSAKPINRGTHEALVESGQSMVRVDVFSKDGKYYLVPIYTYDTIRPELPNRAVMDGRSRNKWPKVDETYTFHFSLQKNEFLRIKRSGFSSYEEGYYLGIHSKSGAFILKNQDGSSTVNANGKEEPSFSVGARTLEVLEKYIVDPLGRKQRIKQERRLPFNLKYKKKRNGV